MTPEFYKAMANQLEREQEVVAKTDILSEVYQDAIDALRDLADDLEDLQ